MGGNSSLVNSVVREDLLGVLSYRNVAVAHGQHDFTAFEQFRKLIEGFDALGILLRNSQNHFVFQQVQTCGAVHEVKALAVFLTTLGIQLIHLLGGGRDENITVGPLLNLGFQGAGGIIGGHDGDAFINGLIGCNSLIQGFLQRGGGKDNEIYRFRSILSFSIRGVICLISAAAAGCEGQDHC